MSQERLLSQQSKTQNNHINGFDRKSGERIFFPEAQVIFDRSVEAVQIKVLGESFDATHIESSEGPFHLLPEYKVDYPNVVKRALADIYSQYNRGFKVSVEKNREWETDFRYAMTPNGTPVNGWIQIDMVGIPDEFLMQSTNFSQEQVSDVLRRRIFEIENSLAMYQLLQRLFAQNGEYTFFEREFRASLDALRQKHRKPIALLAVTEQKYQAMKEAEFGKRPDEPITDGEVRELSGFDKFFGPKDFEEYLKQNGGEYGFLLYARTSDPLEKLRNPKATISIPLLENPQTRRIIKANAITFNIDDPSWAVGDPRRINDTKEYLLVMGLAYPLRETMENIYSEAYKAYLKRGGKGTAPEDILSEDLKKFLIAQGLNPADVNSGSRLPLRFKPMQSSYGCYGHEDGRIDADLRQSMRRHLRDRGPYLIQPEMKIPVITNETDGKSFTYIDRNFLTTDGDQIKFLGGFRSLMPLDSYEAVHGRNHGSGSTVWAEIR